MLTFLWFIIGQTWVYGADHCSTTAPSLYKFCVVIIVLAYFVLVSDATGCCLPLFEALRV